LVADDILAIEQAHRLADELAVGRARDAYNLTAQSAAVAASAGST